MELSLHLEICINLQNEPSRQGESSSPTPSNQHTSHCHRSNCYGWKNAKKVQPCPYRGEGTVERSTICWKLLTGSLNKTAGKTPLTNNGGLLNLPEVNTRLTKNTCRCGYMSVGFLRALATSTKMLMSSCQAQASSA